MVMLMVIIIIIREEYRGATKKMSVALTLNSIQIIADFLGRIFVFIDEFVVLIVVKR